MYLKCFQTFVTVELALRGGGELHPSVGEALVQCHQVYGLTDKDLVKAAFIPSR